MGLINSLRFRVDLYGLGPFVNELGEDDLDYAKVKTLWADINVVSGAQKEAPGNSVFAEVTHKITVRIEAAREITTDMYFIHQGQRYDIKYFYPHYKHRDRMELYCRLEVGK